MQIDKQTYILTEKGRFEKIALIIGIVGLVLSAVGYFVDSRQFFFSYLLAFAFWVTLGAGGLFLNMLHYLVAARWTVVLRRFAEATAWTLPFMAIFFIPILFGLHDLYHWSHPDLVAKDHILQGKAAYLNIPFFIIRYLFYFAVWFVLVRLLNKYSLKQDEGFTVDTRQKLRKVSAPGMILFAFTITFASFDWLMSLDAHWYSTIFGVYIYSGGVVGFLTFLTMIVLYFHKKNILTDVITVEHYHDLGKLTFAFVIFWGYMAFSQYLLIWYANIPEETIWFMHRWVGTWKTASLVLVFGNFVIPFFILITRSVKRNPLFLKIMMGWIFIMHYVDLYWVVMPSLHHENVHISWMDFTTVVGIGGIFCWIFFRRLAKYPLIPKTDPKLEGSIKLISD